MRVIRIISKQLFEIGKTYNSNDQIKNIYIFFLYVVLLLPWAGVKIHEKSKRKIKI